MRKYEEKILQPLFPRKPFDGSFTEFMTSLSNIEGDMPAKFHLKSVGPHCREGVNGY